MHGRVAHAAEKHERDAHATQEHDPRFSGINPYALGFAMMQDIERICTEPTAEDRD